MMVKAVKAPEGDFRDWDAIRGWADEIAATLG
jgi:menaquinone-dependent protoporphyrinogen oxidase